MTISDEGIHHQTNAPRAECIRCRTVYPPHLVWWAFRTRRAALNASCPVYRKRVCRACEQTARDQRKQRNRWAVKAHGTIRRHATGLRIEKEELITIYGWDPQRLADDAEHQYASACNYCGKPYAGMGHGSGDITLDVQDRDRPPYYGQVQGRGVRRRRVILRLGDLGGQCCWGGLLFCGGVGGELRFAEDVEAEVAA
jgi:hypothetical protein